MFAPFPPSFPAPSPRLSLGLRVLLAPAAALLLTHCSSPSTDKADVIVSVKDQRMGLYKEGRLTQSFKVSTSKFGVGDKPGSCCTPLGKHEVIAKIGHGLPTGAVLHNRQWSGEVLKPNAPGRDPIVSRILWLGGLEPGNRNAANRFIYIHGTAEENRIGTPASYGCVRMRSNDVVSIFEKVSIGDTVLITEKVLPSSASPETHEKVPPPSTAPKTPPLDVTSAAIAHTPFSNTKSTKKTSPPTPAPSPRGAAPSSSQALPKTVPKVLTADGRIVPAESVKDDAKKKSEPVKGQLQGNGRQSLRLPVGGSA